MKFFFDLLPVILFFASFKWAEGHQQSAADLMQQLTGLTVTPAMAPILIATLVVIIATLCQVAWVHFKHGKVDKMLWFSLILVVAFGGMTLAFQNETFIKWKPTVLYWAFAAALLGGTLLLKKNLMRT
ncbi:MAG TPA: septation protein IspZ, partial [Rhodocyclaceae bacterium]|nr:septation protein IspZ [Rhodocyclaceae bacterium]